MENSLINQRYRVLSGFALKRIAVISMLIDHFGSIVMDGVLAPYRTDGYIYFTADMPFFIRNAPYIKGLCEILGSVAFPIFCYLIAEGFIHTRSRLKYGLLTLIFALVSEYPYDLAHYGTVDFSLQNVMFTLCIGIFTLLVISHIEVRFQGWKRWLLIGGVTLLAGALSFLIRSEYVFLGIAAMVLLYLLRDKSWRLAGLAPLLVVSPWILLALPPLLLYSGERGKGSKYFFYIFYPSHFLLFAAIAWLLAGRAI